jgi:hypothetical protein
MKKYVCQICGKKSQAQKLSVDCIVCGAISWLPWTHDSCVARAKRDLDHGHSVEEVVRGDARHIRRLRRTQKPQQKKLRWW